jgi:hypothetical protein
MVRSYEHYNEAMGSVKLKNKKLLNGWERINLSRRPLHHELDKLPSSDQSQPVKTLTMGM